MIWLILLVIFLVVFFIAISSNSDKKTTERRAKIEESIRTNSANSSIKKSWNEQQIDKVKEYHATLVDNPEMDFGVLHLIEIKGILYRTKKAQNAASYLKINDMVWLEPDPKNKYDKYAIKVSTTSEFIGYVDATESKYICELMERCFTIDSFICDKINIDIPYLYMDIYYSGHKLILPEGENLTYEEAKTKGSEYQDKIIHLRKQLKKYQKTADDKQLIGDTKLADKALKNVEIYKDEIVRVNSEYKNHCKIYQISYNDMI